MPLLYTPDLLFEGFSLSRAVLLDSEGNEQPDGEIYGVRSAVWEPEIESYDEFSHEKLINVWSDVRRVNFTLEAGYTSLTVWSKMTGSAVASSGGPSEFQHSLLMWEHGRSNGVSFPIRITFPAKDAQGRTQDLALTLFTVVFKPPRVNAASYKEGHSVTYEGTVVISPTDETGEVLERSAFGRIDAAFTLQPYSEVYEDSHPYDGDAALTRMDGAPYTYDGDVHKTVYR